MTTARRYHTLLPVAAQDTLMDAACTPTGTGVLECLARRIAVDEAVASVQRAYPQYFHQPEKEQQK